MPPPASGTRPPLHEWSPGTCEPQPPEIIGPWFLWKLLIDERHQGRGYGSEVVRQVAEIIRAEGATEPLTSIVPGDGGPPDVLGRVREVPLHDASPASPTTSRWAMIGPETIAPTRRVFM